MDLSVVIVSYNVLPFLRQCIASVVAACDSITYEIIIVDNDSKDGSATYLSNIGNDQVQVILNDSNSGYGSAMNQGIRMVQGEHLLLLNPDTIITKEAVSRSIEQLNSNPQCGAVGVRMIDGHGKYLKESKRGYPTPLSSFYKISGLSKIFPSSKRFAHYHQGHLDPISNHKIDILTGAYLMTRTELIKEIGGFDERYFMYGEDIDLSHSITALGYHNYYIGETSIIHFKGESSRKESLKNTYHFYNSMLLFTKKYSAGNLLYIGLLSLVLTLVGSIRWIKLNIIPVLVPLVRFGLYGLILLGTSKIWASLYFGDPSYFNYQRHTILVMVYAAILSIGYYVGGRGIGKLQNLVWAMIAILTVYSLLPLSLRSSRAVIVIGASTIVILEILLQAWRSWQDRGSISFWNQKRRALLLGQYDQCHSALQNLQSQHAYEYNGIVSDQLMASPECLTSFEHLENYLSDHQIDTMTMHMESMSMNQILTVISKYGSSYQYLLYSSKNNSIIDSPDSNTQGTVSIVEISWAIASPLNKRAKRAIDIVSSLTFLIFLPILIWFVENRLGWISNIYQSLLGKTSWVGYSKDDYDLDQLPKLRPAVIKLKHEPGKGHFENVSYARDYTYLKDISMIFNSFTALGNKVEFNAKN